MGVWVHVAVFYFGVSLMRRLLGSRKEKSLNKPAWVLSKDAPAAARKETAVWMNRILSKVFESWMGEVSELTRKSIQDVLDELSIFGIRKFTMTKFDLGNTAPYFNNFRSYPLAGSMTTLSLDGDILWVNPGMEVEIAVELDLKVVGIPIRASLKDLSLQATTRLKLSMREDAQPESVLIDIMQEPKVEFNLCLQGAVLGAVSDFAQRKVSSVLFEKLHPLPITFTSETPDEEMKIEEFKDYVSVLTGPEALSFRPSTEGILLMTDCVIDVSNFHRHAKDTSVFIQVRLGSAKYVSQRVRGNTGERFQFVDRIRLFVQDIETSVLQVEVLEHGDDILERFLTRNRVAAWIPVKELIHPEWRIHDFVLRPSIAGVPGRTKFSKGRATFTFEPYSDLNALFQRVLGEEEEIGMDQPLLTRESRQVSFIDSFIQEDALGVWEVTVVEGKNWPTVQNVFPGSALACSIHCAGSQSSSSKVAPDAEPTWNDCLEASALSWSTQQLQFHAEVQAPMRHDKSIGSTTLSLTRKDNQTKKFSLIVGLMREDFI
ncbi:hypothetical protein NDN08_004792 [Rhodosorus marinus]|uniref:SMP-LTD domain-containing protein n=1 Tax=Rhodosorus marinus TaxID=101924 RepID=A0AAV8UQC3_9RHOD|nr:hypothetical protein NDN08_004792 [Rhodosorus marinus]